VKEANVDPIIATEKRAGFPSLRQEPATPRRVLGQMTIIGMANEWRTHMKRFAVVAATVLSVAFGAQAMAQQIAVEVAPDTRTTIKEYVVKEKIRPVTVKERVVVGSALPADVQLSPAPTAWGPSVSKYHYIYSDNHVVLVEPSSRKVIQIIE
jgi:uncharacterized protein DUF1236